ncbi:Ribonuclease 2 [Theobroma cacao]|uniref:Ribonuclease 2 n=1 Tax=Theobroma cacao TaxID=3641 RepID=A0A061FSK9_THECC|nr:Ribonuclease 2 [Theobroma cacao]
MQRQLLVAAVLATLSLLISGQTDYPDFFYKLSLQWPPSVCANAKCRSPIPRTFTIHGLWLQSVEDDEPIRLKPRQTPLYKAKEIRDAIYKTFGKYPEISCGKVNNTGKLLLNEIRLCFERANPPFVLRDCPKRNSTRCSNGNDQLKFPPRTSRV